MSAVTLAQASSTSSSHTAQVRSDNEPRLLIVDDDPMVRRLLRTVMLREGIAHELASNGLEAIEKYRQFGSAICVALLDVQMPGLDGPHTFYRLKDLNPDLVCLFMSGNCDPYTAEGLLRMGAAEFLPKPFNLPKMVSLIRLRLAAARRVA